MGAPTGQVCEQDVLGAAHVVAPPAQLKLMVPSDSAMTVVVTVLHEPEVQLQRGLPHVVQALPFWLPRVQPCICGTNAVVQLPLAQDWSEHVRLCVPEVVHSDPNVQLPQPGQLKPVPQVLPSVSREHARLSLSTEL